MAITLFDIAKTTGSTLTLPAGIAAGDLLVLVANRSSNTTVPSLGSGMVNKGTSSANSSASRIMSKVLDGTEVSITGLTNNTEAVAEIYRSNSGAALSVGTVTGATGNNGTISYPAAAFGVADGSSWGGRAGYHRASGAVNSNPPAGTILRVEQGVGPEAALFDTNGGVTGLSSATAVVGNGSGWHAWSFEIVETAAGGGVSGSVSITEAADAVSSAATVAIAGSLAKAEGADTATATGSVTVTGAASLLEAGDTVSGSGQVSIVGGGSVSEASDSATGTGAVGIAAGLNATEDSDTATGAAALAVSGAGLVTEADDTLSATGGAEDGITGSLQVVEQSDIGAATGSVAIAGAGALTEDGDVAAAVAAVVVAGASNLAEAADTAAASAVVLVNGSSLLQEENDAAEVQGSVAVFGALEATEVPDALVALGTIFAVVLPTTPPAPIRWASVDQIDRTARARAGTRSAAASPSRRTASVN